MASRMPELPEALGPDRDGESPVGSLVDPWPDVGVDELEGKLLRARRLMRVAKREMAMFEEYHTMYRDRHDMTGVEARPQKGAPAKEHEVAAAKRGSQRSVRRSKVSGRHSTTSEVAEAPVLRLNPDERATIAARAFDRTDRDLKGQLARVQTELDSVVAEHDGMLESVEQLRASRMWWGRKVLNFGAQIEVEPVRRLFMQQAKAIDTLGDRLGLKTSTEWTQMKKLEEALAKSNSGTADNISPIDFRQLKIERAQLSDALHSKNHTLVAVKQAAAQAVKRQNSVMAKLAKEEVQCRLHERRIGELQASVANVESEMEAVGRETASARRERDRLREQLARFKTPSVMNYIRQTAEVQQLVTEQTRWDRRVRIVASNMRRRTKSLHATLSPSRPSVAAAPRLPVLAPQL